MDWREHVSIDPRHFRLTEVNVLVGDASKARRVLGWEPKINFKELVRLMIEHDLDLARQESAKQKIETVATKPRGAVIDFIATTREVICSDTSNLKSYHGKPA